MHGMPLDMWVERRALGRRGVRIAAMVMVFIVVSMPLALLAVSTDRAVPQTMWSAVLVLTGLLALLMSRALMMASRGESPYVTSLSYLFIRRPPEEEVEEFVEDFVRRRKVRAPRTEVQGFTAFMGDELSVVILAAGRLPGVGGVTMRDHTGDNIAHLRAFHRAASAKWELDRDVANGKRVVPRTRDRRSRPR